MPLTTSVFFFYENRNNRTTQRFSQEPLSIHRRFIYRENTIHIYTIETTTAQL
jgi:hypothetical protein